MAQGGKLHRPSLAGAASSAVSNELMEHFLQLALTNLYQSVPGDPHCGHAIV